MKKAYDAHEVVYQQMREKGITAWGQKKGGKIIVSCVPETRKFLRDVLSQPWAPKKGRIIELGCGTAPTLRHFYKKGFTGVGIDVSKTAIEMAKQQSRGLALKFFRGDVCALNKKNLGKFDIVLDGMCLHCLTDAKDRKAYFRSVSGLLKDDGIFILLTMCGPLNKKRLLELYEDQKFIKKVIYVPFEEKGYKGLTAFDGKQYIPTRYFEHWKSILKELGRFGLEAKLIRYKAGSQKDFCGTLRVGAVKKSNSI